MRHAGGRAAQRRGSRGGADGVNGYVCKTAQEAASAVGRLDRIDRRAVRQDAEQRFAAGVIVSQYEALYHEALA